jgi:hypothetical protein
MARVPDPGSRLAPLERFARGLARRLRRLAVAAALGVVPIALLLRRDGFGAVDVVLTALLLAPAAVVLLFTQGMLELVGLPARLRRIPGEGQDRLAEVARLAGEIRSTRTIKAPLVLWRLRGAIGSLRDVAGIALPLRVLTPPFLVATGVAVLACALIALVGLVALLVLAAG